MSSRDYGTLARDKQMRLNAARSLSTDNAKIVPPERAADLLYAVIRPGDRVNIEGNNQKQADFLAKTFSSLDPKRVNRLHMVQSSVALPEHIAVFDRGIAEKLDFAFSGPQAKELARIVNEGKVKIGAIHTYLELFGRYFVDLTPRVAMVAAELADAHGNLYTGFNTEETPTIVEATAFRHGIVIAQVREITEKLPRVDIPGDQVDFVVPCGHSPYIEPLFTRDPAKITEMQIFLGMLAMKGIYVPYQIKSINHGIGYGTSAIELMLPTYGEKLGLKGKACTHWILNPHPSLIPAIEAGFVQSVHSFGSEPGMEEYIRARSDIFFIGSDGSLRSNRLLSQVAGLYASDMFVGLTLQIDGNGNSSTATVNRIAGFGGAPNLGDNPGGRRHVSEAWLKAGMEDTASLAATGGVPRGRKLVVQITPTQSEKKGIPVFVEKLDAEMLFEQKFFPLPPIMLYGDVITHIVTEKGIAVLHKCPDLSTRQAAIRAVAGDTPVGRKEKKAETEKLRKKGIVLYPEDIGVRKEEAVHSLLAARSIPDLVTASGGLYKPPARFLSD
ncbi:MAG: malonate decarboxylase subunit alpha [Candidatus Aureabacteria bacterium]|nr:malonate decarboxylase subunit alpha [Candidatus Auribacterota bacterium]